MTSDVPSNKEVIEKLKAYFLTQNPETVAYALASLMVDVNRIRNLSDLPELEAFSLSMRLELMAKELYRFIEHGPQGDLKMTRMNSDDH